MKKNISENPSSINNLVYAENPSCDEKSGAENKAGRAVSIGKSKAPRGLSSIKRISLLSILIALAMVLSYLESLIPPIVPIPGVKLGLANSVTVFALYSLKVYDGAVISALRVGLSAWLFGNVFGLAYSFSGAFLSFTVMVLAKKLRLFSPIGVSVLGGVFHNVGQVLCAMLVMRTAGLISYLAPLLISGTVAGIGIGVVAGIIVKKTKRPLERYFKG